MSVAIMMNYENFIPNNNFKVPMINGEIAPVLGSYIESETTVTQLAIVYVS